MRSVLLVSLSSLLPLVGGLACVDIRVGDDDGPSASAGETTSPSPTGDADPDPSTGDGAPGDGDPGDGDGTPGDGDGDASESGDGDTLSGLEPGPVLGGDGSVVVSLAPSPAGDRLLASFGDKQVRVFDLADASATTIHTIGDGDLFEAGAAAWGGQGAAVGTFSACLVFDDALALAHTVTSRCAHLSLSSDGGTLVHTTADGIASVDVNGGTPGASASVGVPAGLAVLDATAYVLVSDPVAYSIVPVALDGFAPGTSHAIDARGLFGGGPTLATLRYAEARLWSDLAGAPVTLATGDGEDQKRVAVSPDGRWAASIGATQGIHVYDAATGAKLASAALEVGSGDGLAFAPDGTRLFAGSAAGVQVFTLVFE